MSRKPQPNRYSRERVQCAADGCTNTYVKGKRGRFCYQHCARPEHDSPEDYLPGYVRLADQLLPKCDPWGQRGDWEP